ncbi:MAG: 50S ribosomal protein L37e [Candidatus Nanoarchaeia archaeon]
MVKGTPSKGKRTGKKSHLRCRRCGKHSYNFQKKHCSSCGFPNKRLRKYSWQNKRFGKRLV